jgi:hypothetical protein
MHTIKVRSHVGSNGLLELQVPTGHADQDLEVIVIYQTVGTEYPKLPEGLGWSPDFFEQTFGSIPDLVRPSQGDLQERDWLE